jgi:hypothetical protein
VVIRPAATPSYCPPQRCRGPLHYAWRWRRRGLFQSTLVSNGLFWGLPKPFYPSTSVREGETTPFGEFCPARGAGTGTAGEPATPAPHLENWFEWREAAERAAPGYVEEELRGYLECGILCFRFGRALCTGCGQGFVIAFSCKSRGVCPFCNGRHMARSAAHLADHVIPPVPVRQWVISVPKRLRGMLADRPRAVAALTKIFLTRCR